MEKCAAASARLAAEAAYGELHAKEDQLVDRRTVDAKIARLEKRCALLERERLGEVHVVRADSTTDEWMQEQFASLYGERSVKFDQELTLRFFPLSDKRIGEPALQQIYHWKESYDVYQPGRTAQEEALLNEARIKFDKEPGACAKRQLNKLLLRLALLSGSRKAAWCQIIAERENIEAHAKSFVSDGKNDPRSEGSLLAAIDRALKIVEQIRQLHWRELDLLRDKAGDLQRGLFNVSASFKGQEDDEMKLTDTEAEVQKADAVQEYLFSEVLSLHKTFTGRQGFNNRCIEVLDYMRRTLLVQRSQACVARELQEWDEEEMKRAALDEYKATIMICELEKGVDCGVFPTDAVPLLIY